MKIHVGQTVDVIVKSVQAYGLVCAYDGDTELLALIPGTSWTASYCSCEQITDVGDLITVKALHVDNDSGRIAASIRRRFPDPWASDTLQVVRKYVRKSFAMSNVPTDAAMAPVTCLNWCPAHL